MFEEDESRRELMNLLDIGTLKSILSAFTTTTGLMANIVDVNGRSIFPGKILLNAVSFVN